MWVTGFESSNVKGFGYDGRVLTVEFKSGAKYRYRGVPRSVFLAMTSAESVGKFLNAKIKGKYEYEKVG